jgi:glycosyltransferase involved in cell wall biosynthesis
MESPRVSVVIPAYNNAEFLGEAIESVLDQTYPNFELIVVNDASPDNTNGIVGKFKDPRIKYIVHEENHGLAATRNTGMRASTGEFIALLDGDDILHPEKLQAHVEFYNSNPDTGVTYNARFELNHSSKTIRELWRPPTTVTLADLVLGFPFSPSDMVLRREWAFRVNLFDESHTYYGEDLDINCRLALAGCKFASVDRALNYRRFHSGRVIKDMRAFHEDEIRPLYKIFADPRFPSEIMYLRDFALSNRFISWTNMAFDQEETALGQEYCREAVRLNPSVTEGHPCQLVDSFLSYCILDESRNHEILLRRIFAQLPSELRKLSDQCEWATARGYLLKGTRAVMWGRHGDGQDHFARAVALGAQIDTLFLRQLTAQLLSYEAEFGSGTAGEFLQRISPFFESLGGRESIPLLKACYSVNRAFRSFSAHEYQDVMSQAMTAILNDPNYLTNRGVLAIMIRSILGSIRNVIPVDS